MENAPEIVTARLKISKMNVRDADAFHAYRSDPEVHAHLSFVPSSLRDSQVFLKNFDGVRFDTPKTWFQLGVYLSETGVLIGDMGVHFVDPESQLVEIGYTFSPRFHGLGYATEAVAGLIRFLFETLGKHRVHASVDPNNSSSIALLKRLGMRQEAHHRSSLWFKDEWVDDMIFALLREDWIEPRP